MTPASGRLFFYGVLRADVADWDFLRGIGPGIPATARGTLRAVPTPQGWYPAMTAGAGAVHGLVHEAAMLDIAAVDRFEGYHPADPAGSEYLRSTIRVATADASLEADAYLWNCAGSDDLVAIPHGDFARWLAETGNRPFAR